MKKRVFVIGIISIALVIGFFLVGCAGAPPHLGTYGNTSEDQVCTLEIAGGLKVVEFDGNEVSWAKNGSGPGEGTISSKAWEAQKKGSKYRTTIRIPAGSHTLQANIYLWDYNRYPGAFGDGLMGQRAGYIRARGLQISNNFEPGKTYFLRPVFVNKLLGRELEIIEYNNSGPISGLERVYLRIDKDGVPTAIGNSINFR